MSSEYRSRCLREKGTDCLLCSSNAPVVAHHIDGNRSNNVLDNLIPVCRSCHISIHAGSDGYESWTEKLPQSARTTPERPALGDSAQSQVMHLPEGQHKRLHHRYNRLKADYEYEFGESFELNRHYFPLIIQYGLDQMVQKDIETIRDDLSSSDSEAGADG